MRATAVQDKERSLTKRASNRQNYRQVLFANCTYLVPVPVILIILKGTFMMDLWLNFMRNSNDMTYPYS